MMCRHCGGRTAKRDRRCVYCGKRLRLVPTWAKLLALPIVATVVTASVILANRGSTTPETSSIPSVTIDAEYGEPHAVVVDSEYVSSGTSPQIDGVLAAGEWSQPAFTLNVEFHETRATTGGGYTEEDIGTGEARGYLVNDNVSLYVAVVLTADLLDPSSIDKKHAGFHVQLTFDGNGNGAMDVGEDIRTVCWSYGDLIYPTDCCWITQPGVGRDVQQDGEAAARFANEEDAYYFELRIPLCSGDPHDLAVTAGDTIGLLMTIYPTQSNQAFYFSNNKVAWPGEDWAAPNTYAKIVLATGPG